MPLQAHLSQQLCQVAPLLRHLWWLRYKLVVRRPEEPAESLPGRQRPAGVQPALQNTTPPSPRRGPAARQQQRVTIELAEALLLTKASLGNPLRCMDSVPPAGQTLTFWLCAEAIRNCSKLTICPSPATARQIHFLSAGCASGSLISPCSCQGIAADSKAEAGL